MTAVGGAGGSGGGAGPRGWKPGGGVGDGARRPAPATGERTGTRAAADGATTPPGPPPRSRGPAVLVMAKAPDPGRVKTRLQPAYSAEECAAIQRVLIRRTGAWAARVAPGAMHVAHDPPEGWGRMVEHLPPSARPIAQRGAHLGERLAHAIDEVFDNHDGPLLVVGVDTRLTERHAREALGHLRSGIDLVFGPALDGGYYLVGMNRRPPPDAALFDRDIGWGGADVLDKSLAAATAAGLTTALLPLERDLDTPADALALLASEHEPQPEPEPRHEHQPQPDPDPDPDPALAAILRSNLVSVVIPTLNEEQQLPGLLDHLATLPGRFEVIVADGGSTDGTVAAAERHPLEPKLLTSERGRAAQLNAGAKEANGDPIVFLHADTRLPATAHESLTTTPAEGGNFAIRFEGRGAFERTLAVWYRAQRRMNVYYGDSAIWLTRRAFDALGGFRRVPIMEDYDLARRLHRRTKNTACLPGPAVTSARRWRSLGVPRTVLSWVVIRWLFVAGVPPERLAHLYRRAR